MKFLGAIVIILSGPCIGRQPARELKQREERLLDLKRTIQWFRAEIRYTARPLSELISENEDSDFCLLAAEEPDFVRDPKEALQKAGEKLLKGSADLELYRGREEQAMMTTLAGLIVVLMMIINEIDALFQAIKSIFQL